MIRREEAKSTIFFYSPVCFLHTLMTKLAHIRLSKQVDIYIGVIYLWAMAEAVALYLVTEDDTPEMTRDVPALSSS